MQSTSSGDVGGATPSALSTTARVAASAGSAPWLVVALAAFGLCTTVGYAAGKRLVERRARLLEAARAAAANDERPREPTARYFLVINLFNQLSMPSAKRHVVIAACAERLGAIGDLYHGRCDTLPGTGLVMRFDDVPLVAEALEWAQRGVATGASDRNWNGYRGDVVLPAGAPDWVRKLLTDPQTSGGLLVACAPDAERAVLEAFAEGGFAEARTIGRLDAGAPRLTVT